MRVSYVSCRRLRVGASMIPFVMLGIASAAQAQAGSLASAAPDTVAATAPAASAQDPSAHPADQSATEAQAANEAASGELLITGRRRSELLRDAPLAVTSVSAPALAQQSIVSVTDLNRVAPNVILRQTNSGGGTVDAVIRGQSYAISNIANDPPVGLYFDDVIVTQNKGAAVGIFDVSRIEVDRGVQGTLRGRNNTGGAISIYTNRPELGKYSADVTATYGSRNYVQSQAVLNVPLGDTLAVRFGAQRIIQDGWGHSIASGQEYGGRDQWIARGQALFQPSSNISLNLLYEHVDIDQNPLGRRAIPGSGAYNALISGTLSGVNTSGLKLTPDQIIPSNFWNGSTGFIMPNDVAKADFVRGTLQVDLSSAATFKLIGGYRKMSAFGGIDLDATPALVLESNNGGTSHQFTVEPQFSGKLLGGKLNYGIG
ncbi:MAG: TonB-dependent receptor [Alphaproteobacteria bacterium]|nr:TonB-dependent receptor [Alphaproteobacteria bacterium]